MRLRSFLSALVSLLLLLLGPPILAADPAPLPLEAAQRDAREVLALLAAIAAPDPAHPSLGATLAAYAKNTGTDPSRHEGFESAARRILAGGTTTLLAPDATSRRLTALADSIAESLRTLETTRADLRPDNFASTAGDLRAVALLARFHARRILAAIHYNLFLRGQRLPELYAATMDTKAALELWRELTATLRDQPAPGTSPAPPLFLRGPWRDELTRLEFDYKDLEAMCCPPDESWLREKVWTPAK